MMGKRHRWVGVIADAEGYVRQSAASASGGWERRRRVVKAAGGGEACDYGVVMKRGGFSSYVTCIVFLSKTSHNLLASC